MLAPARSPVEQDPKRAWSARAIKLILRTYRSSWRGEDRVDVNYWRNRDWPDGIRQSFHVDKINNKMVWTGSCYCCLCVESSIPQRRRVLPWTSNGAIESPRRPRVEAASTNDAPIVDFDKRELVSMSDGGYRRHCSNVNMTSRGLAKSPNKLQFGDNSALFSDSWEMVLCEL